MSPQASNHALSPEPIGTTCWDCKAVYRIEKRRFLFWLYKVSVAEHSAGCRVAAYERGEYNAIGG